MRKLKRLVAKTNMKKKGICKICKDFGDGSYFAKHWREYI